MNKDKTIDDFYNRFKDYKKPSLLQREFLEFYQKRDSLNDLEKKKFFASVHALQAIDTLNKKKQAIRDITKEEKKIETRADNHSKIIIGAGLSNALVSNSPNLHIFKNAYELLMRENFIANDDSKKANSFIEKLANKKNNKPVSSDFNNEIPM